MAKPIPCVDAVMTATFPSNNLFFSLPISRPHQSKRKKRKKITQKKIKEKKIISVSFVFVYPPLPPSSSDTIILCRTASPIKKLRDLFAPDGEADGGVRSAYRACITCLQGPDQC
jgi:hypothetical protein